MLLYVPAVCGGVFGLLGGYLADRLGRRRVLVWSILLYAVAAFAAGLATSPAQFLALRCLVWIGIAVEFVAAVAYVAEMFPSLRQREAALGYTQAFSSLGGLLVAAAYYLCVTYADALPEVRGGHQAWRYTLFSGLIPAIPLLLVRPFLPESAVWKQKKAQGALRRLSVRALFDPVYRRTALVTAGIAACSFGGAMGGLQHIPRIVPGLPDLAGMPAVAIEQAVSQVQFWQEIGGLAGRFLLAFLAVRIVSRRRLLRLFQAPSLVFVPFALLFLPSTSLNVFTWAVFFVGLLTVGQFSFYGNYLPYVFPTYLRGTGESFAVNVGGRMFGSVAALLTTQLANYTPGDSAPAQLAHAAGVVVLLVYAAGFAGSFLLPEPERKKLPE
jgi:MFS family permease